MQPVPRPLAGRLDQPLNVGFKVLRRGSGRVAIAAEQSSSPAD